MQTSGHFSILSRRGFLAGCSGAAACLACPAVCRATAATPQSLVPNERMKLRLVYTHPDPKLEGWPYQGYDYESRKKELTERLRRACPNVDFLPVWAQEEADGKKVLEGDGEVDGYLVYLLGIPSSAARAIVFSGRPAILADDLYGGTGQFLGLYGEALRKGMRVAGVSSSRLTDVADAVHVLEALRKFQKSTILDVVNRDLGAAPALYRDTLGVGIQTISAAELDDAYRSADRAEAVQWAQAWAAGAARIVEPSRAEIQKSGAMYVGMSGLMLRHHAQGIAIDCLRLFYGGQMAAYPCLGFFQLNNDGLVGACEADLQSASTMLLLTYLVGRPGYISDPVIDTSKNQIIYAHCVAPNKVFGPGGAANPYHIRSHSEDRKGAAVRSLLPLGEMTTTLKLVPEEKTLVMHQARTVANIDDDRACRTKLAAEPKDARKLAADWRWGWHRVTVYGEYRVPVQTAGSLLGFRVVEEG
ncbi:MAG TPA: hypothetical protein VFA33_12120 [Bryobacteraceae bacterium]|nr:hypothetical protein [Bryobacteraceae bacterium]